MDIKQLEAFTAVAETGSFSRAGELLHLTQPTVSAHISGLEQELRIKLLVRSSSGIYLSEAGKILYSYAKKILSVRDEGISAIMKFAENMNGKITVSASTIPGQYFLPGLLPGFRKKYPDIIFDIHTTDSTEVIHEVASGKAEIGFTGTKLDNKKCVYRRFADDRLVVITPNRPEFRKYLPGTYPVSELMKQPFINREPESGTRKETELFLEKSGFSPSELNTVVEVPSTETIKKMVSEGVGISVISKRASEDYCSFNRILCFDFENATLDRKLYIVRHKNSILSPIAQVFYDFAKNFY